MVDELDERIDACTRDLRALGADHPAIPLLVTVPGVGWVVAYTIASEIGDIRRFRSPKKLAGYTGLCPLVRQSGDRDVRGPLAKNGPKYLRWALIEAAIHAARDPRYKERYERTKRRLGRQRGAKVARVDLARSSPRPSGTSSRRTNPSLRQAPPSPWSLDDPRMELGRRHSLPPDLVLPLTRRP